MPTFGPLLRSYRRRAGLGLRTFATLIDQRASTVSAIESGRTAPWRRADRLSRVAEVLGLVETSELWQELVALAHRNNPPIDKVHTKATLAWWWTTNEAPSLRDDTTNDTTNNTITELAEFIGAKPPEIDAANTQPKFDEPPALTDLAIEWRARKLLGRRNSSIAAAPVDVEAALENNAGIRLEIIPGLIPRFSVQACIVQAAGRTSMLVDRIMADSRPMASYRHLLASCYAPTVLCDAGLCDAGFARLQTSDAWSQMMHDCERFALATLLPAGPVLAGAEVAYRELVEQQGWVEVDDAIRSVRNRLAEQFAVPPAVVHQRLVRWPCHLYGRIAQALAAQEPTLPPADWIDERAQVRQRVLFETAVR